MKVVRTIDDCKATHNASKHKKQSTNDKKNRTEVKESSFGLLKFVWETSFIGVWVCLDTEDAEVRRKEEGAQSSVQKNFQILINEV
jgi:hypothetical protein